MTSNTFPFGGAGKDLLSDDVPKEVCMKQPVRAYHNTTFVFGERHGSGVIK